jgi:hypothetical protein
MSQNHSRNQDVVNVNPSFRTLPVVTTSNTNGASELHAAYDAMPFSKYHKGMPLEDNQTANEFVQNRWVSTTFVINSEHPSHASMSVIMGSAFVHSDSNELNMIARTLFDAGKCSCTKTCVKKCCSVILNFLIAFNTVDMIAIQQCM